MGSTAPSIKQAESKPIFTPGGTQINERLEQVALGLLGNPSPPSLGFNPNFTTQQANAARAARSESFAAQQAPAPATAPSDGFELREAEEDFLLQTSGLDRNEFSPAALALENKIATLKSQAGTGAAASTTGGGDNGGVDALTDSFRFRNIVDEFGNPVAPLRPEEETLRLDQIGSLLASQQRTDVGRASLQDQLLAPNNAQEQSIIDESVRIGGGGFINRFEDEQRDAVIRNLLLTTNAINSNEGVIGGGGSRGQVLRGTAAGEATSRLGEILAQGQRFGAELGQQERPQAFQFARQDINDLAATLGIEEQFGGGERRLEAAGLEAIPRNIEQANREAFFGEEARRQAERLAPFSIAQSTAALPAGQTVPVALPGQQGVGGDIIGSIGKIASAFIGK